VFTVSGERVIIVINVFVSGRADQMGGTYSTGGVFVVKEKRKDKRSTKRQRREDNNVIGKRDQRDNRFE